MTKDLTDFFISRSMHVFENVLNHDERFKASNDKFYEELNKVMNSDDETFKEIGLEIESHNTNLCNRASEAAYMQGLKDGIAFYQQLMGDFEAFK